MRTEWGPPGSPRARAVPAGHPPPPRRGRPPHLLRRAGPRPSRRPRPGGDRRSVRPGRVGHAGRPQGVEAEAIAAAGGEHPEEALEARGAEEVVLTRGVGGCTVRREGTTLHLPAARPVAGVPATGAGDVFSVAYAARRAAGAHPGRRRRWRQPASSTSWRRESPGPRRSRAQDPPVVAEPAGGHGRPAEYCSTPVAMPRAMICWSAGWPPKACPRTGRSGRGFDQRRAWCSVR